MPHLQVDGISGNHIHIKMIPRKTMATAPEPEHTHTHAHAYSYLLVGCLMHIWFSRRQWQQQWPPRRRLWRAMTQFHYNNNAQEHVTNFRSNGATTTAYLLFSANNALNASTNISMSHVTNRPTNVSTAMKCPGDCLSLSLRRFLVHSLGHSIDQAVNANNTIIFTSWTHQLSTHTHTSIQSNLFHFIEWQWLWHTQPNAPPSFRPTDETNASRHVWPAIAIRFISILFWCWFG